MKILAIRGCNLASLDGEFEVDFRQEPLSSTGLFAITGNTGAGKTTILDAMCIALYRHSPRLDNVKRGIKVEGTGNSAISESDVRTILRRGKHKGYAEVDFLAVDGNEYRVRWSISRTHNSPTGNLSAAVHDLTNLTTGEYKRLGANESKDEIPRLVGLEYDQFTRAVLLAQGNFSAFLKADEGEKATMLEALSGTEIYSKISARIYSCTQEAKKELELIEAKRQALHLLSDDETTQLNEEKQKAEKELGEIKISSNKLRAKQEWLQRLVLLNRQIATAEQQLAETKQKLENERPVIEKLKLIDSVQQIRDDFMSLRSLKQQAVNDNTTLTSLTELLADKDAAYNTACRNVEVAADHQEKLNEEYIKSQPLMAEAIRLEKQCAGDTKIHNELLADTKQTKNELDRIVYEVAECRKASTALEQEQQEIRKWFYEHDAYSTAIPMIPAIVANINSIDNERMSVAAKEKSLAQATALLGNYETRLLAARKDEEALKQTMSSEIALLRRRLVEGEPCPVCGSKHHEAVEIAANLLEEKLLEKAKEENSRLLEHLEANVSGCRIEIEKLRAAIEQHNNATTQFNNANLGYLSAVGNAAGLLASKDAASTLTTLASEWKGNEERLKTIDKESALLANRLLDLQARAGEAEKRLHERNERLKLSERSIAEQKERILSILGKWKTADEMQQYYNNAIADANKAFVAATEQKSTTGNERNKINGQIAEKKRQLADAAYRIEALALKTGSFLASRNDGMDETQLGGLLNISHTDITAMRAAIDAVEKAIITATATIQERKKNLDEHNRAEMKPSEQEDAAFIKNGIATLDNVSKEINERLVQINAQLLKDERNRAEFSRYSEEYENRMQQMSHWSTLCKMFGSANGDALKKLAQGYTLDILLDVANIHLSEITKRYRLARFSDDTLGIKVIDLDMMSESRSAHTLSGGETFIVSLALSLALSSLSSNRMSIGSLFIDEGFGALDKDTLQTALMVLEKLQSQGRKIGVISHLSEMLEQIPVKVNVMKVAPGKSKVEIIRTRQ